MKKRVLAINCGSSSLKWGVYEFDSSSEVLVVEGSVSLTSDCVKSALSHVLGLVGDMDNLVAVGHRVVHGGSKFTAPVVITVEVLEELKALSVLAPEHNPQALAAIIVARAAFPFLPQIALFDTAIHRTMPAIASTYPLPLRFRADGLLMRYGFHGLSYQYLMSVLDQSRSQFPQGIRRVICAHLGHGASLAAFKDGVCIDTTMGLTPTGGVPMCTRSGDMDPEVVLFLQQHHGVAPDQIKRILSKESGLLAFSNKAAAGMRALEEAAANSSQVDADAIFSVEYFAYHVRQHVAALTASLQGLDVLVFTAGVGENSAATRARICTGLEFLGVELDSDANQNLRGKNSANGLSTISAPNSRVIVFVIPTNEQIVIARESVKLGLA